MANWAYIVDALTGLAKGSTSGDSRTAREARSDPSKRVFSSAEAARKYRQSKQKK